MRLSLTWCFRSNILSVLGLVTSVPYSSVPSPAVCELVILGASFPDSMLLSGGRREIENKPFLNTSAATSFLQSMPRAPTLESLYTHYIPYTEQLGEHDKRQGRI